MLTSTRSWLRNSDAFPALLLVGGLVLTGCRPVEVQPPNLDSIAASYVQLVLAVGLHDGDYVDAYFGPDEWKTQVEQEQPTLEEIGDRAAVLLNQLEAIEPTGDDQAARRHTSLTRTVESLIARVEYLKGARKSFDEESQALFDAVAPSRTAEHFRQILDGLDEALPGDGSLIDRYASYKEHFVIPPDKLDAVFQTAIEACRERTREHLDLPADESFTVEYVTDKSWSGYNWYKGDYHSLIQVNTDLPIYIDRAIDLACHEGYPGHHVYNLLLEQKLLRDKGWIEYSVYPLFSPRSLISEGTANFGIEVAFPAAKRMQWEAENLFPLAGLDPSRAEEYYGVQALVQKLSHAGNEAARHYLDGEIDG